MKLTEHFTLEELTASDTAARLGLDNTASAEQTVKLTKVAQGLEKVRVLAGLLHVNSGYRSEAVNQAVGSKSTSQHVKCEAADVKSLAGISAKDLCKMIRDSDIHFDQLIYEFDSWMHISFTDKPRHSVLTIDKAGTRQGIG